MGQHPTQMSSSSRVDQRQRHREDLNYSIFDEVEAFGVSGLVMGCALGFG